MTYTEAEIRAHLTAGDWQEPSQLEAAVEALLALLDQVRARAVEWVPVGERVPPPGFYLLCFPDGVIRVGWRDGDRWGPGYERVTHWAELPAVPES